MKSCKEVWWKWLLEGFWIRSENEKLRTSYLEIRDRGSTTSIVSEGTNFSTRYFHPRRLKGIDDPNLKLLVCLLLIDI